MGVVIVIAVVALGAGIVIFRQSNKESSEIVTDTIKKLGADTMIKSEDAVMMEEKKAMEKSEDIMMKDGAVPKFSGTVLAGSKSPLIDFNKADYDLALKTNKLIVLYFYANWCPICKAEVANSLYPVFNALTTDEVIGFQVGFNDNQTDKDEKGLASQFGVPYQHTKVFVKNGQRILKSPEQWNEARYLSEINKAK